MPRIFQRGQPAAGDGAAVESQDVQAGAAEVGLQDKAVVTCSENDAVVGVGHEVMGAAAQSGGKLLSKGMTAAPKGARLTPRVEMRPPRTSTVGQPAEVAR